MIMLYLNLNYDVFDFEIVRESVNQFLRVPIAFVSNYER